MDIGKSFTYVFDDEEWVSKLLIAAVITLVSPIGLGIPLLLLLGYTVQIVRNVRRGDPRPLPMWDNLGDKFREGLLLFVGFLVYSLPLILLVCPLIVIASVTSDNGSPQGGLVALAACFGCLAFLWILVVAIVSPALYVRFAETGELGAFFRFGDIISFTTSNIGPIVIVVLMGWVASIVAGIVGLVLCLVGSFVTSHWAALVMAHLYSQVAMKPVVPPTPPAPPEPPQESMVSSI